MAGTIIVVASWEDENATSLTLHSFKAGEQEFIPLFTDLDAFREQAQGSGFEADGVEIDLDLLGSILRGDEKLVLNPGKPDAVAMSPDVLTDPAFREMLRQRRTAE